MGNGDFKGGVRAAVVVVVELGADGRIPRLVNTSSTSHQAPIKVSTSVSPDRSEQR